MNDSRLVDFLYILARDHVPLGTLESIMWDQVDTEESSYCNTYLEEYVRDLSQRLTDDQRPITDWKHMYRSPDGHKRVWIDSKGNETPAPRQFVGKDAPGGARYRPDGPEG